MNKQVKLKTIGTDFEIFLKDKRTNEVVSAEGIARGSKYDPYQFDPENPYFSTSLDNVLFEATIAPATTAKQWIKYLNKSMRYIKSVLPRELDILVTPSANLDEKYLRTENAQLFGCDIDFNAYTRSPNDRPCAEDSSLRSAGGHIHVGFDNIEVEFDGNVFMYEPSEDGQRTELIKALDLHIGVPSVILEPDNKRKELYGKAGAYRPKQYGKENKNSI